VVGDATSSPEDGFPAIVGPDLQFHDGDPNLYETDAFVARISADGSGFDYSGYIGGPGTEAGDGIAVGADDVAYVVGGTTSRPPGFPALGGPDSTGGANSPTFEQPYRGSDGFIARVGADGVALASCGFIGGAEFDEATGVAVRPDGRAYVIGYTNSPPDSFPLRGGPRVVANTGAGEWWFVAVVAPVEQPSSLAGRLVHSATSIDFGIGAGLGMQRILRLTNAGPGDLVVNLPGDLPPFTVRPSGTRVLRPGAGLDVKIRQTFVGRGGSARLLSIVSTDPQSPLSRVVLKARAE
jgi:hypothetical protein